MITSISQEMIKSISQETNKINIVPNYENLLITYARLYSKMTDGGRKLIDEELSKMGKILDNLERDK